MNELWEENESQKRRSKYSKHITYTHTNMAIALLVVGTAVYASSFPHSRLLKFPLLAALGVVGKRLKKKTKKKDNINDVFGERDDDDDDDDDDDETPATLRWSRVGLSVTTTRKKKTTTNKVLENVSGEAMPGRVLAIVGPSGAGKTSLLNALAKRVPKKGAELTGRII
tara:strand:+ start:385 stop:891 length:507 start_codon:yes stop_codon:yes gene_type:complete